MEEMAIEGQVKGLGTRAGVALSPATLGCALCLRQLLAPPLRAHCAVLIPCHPALSHVVKSCSRSMVPARVIARREVN